MLPNLATDILVRDKSASGFASAEKRAKGFASKSAAHVEKSGLAKLGKQFEGLAKFRNLDFGFDKLGGSLQFLGRSSGEMAAGFGAAATRAVGFGAAADTMLGGVAAAAGTATAAIAGLATVAGGVAVGAYIVGEKYAKSGAEIDRTSKTIGIAARDLQGLRAAGEQAGIGADAVTSGVDGLSASIYDMRSGTNNQGLAVLDKLGIKLKYTKDGAADTTAMLYDLSDAIARQKDPQVQRAIARLYGVEGMLPLLRQGSAAMKAASSDFTGSAAALSDSEVAKAATTQPKAVRLKQHLGGIETRAGVAAMDATAAVAEHGVPVADKLSARAASAAASVSGFLRDPVAALKSGAESVEHGAESLAHSGAEAGRQLVEGGKSAAHDIAEAARAGGSNLASRATSFFQALGFSPEQARGMTAGAYAESGLNPKAVNPKSGAFGIGQWLGGRKKELFNRFGANPSFDDQLSFMGWELMHSEHAAGAAIQGADTASDAMQTYVRRFMRPAAGPETAGDIGRGDRFLASPQANAKVTIELKGAPPGTTVRTAAGRGVDVDMSVQRGMSGP